MDELFLSYDKNISDKELGQYNDLYARCIDELEPLAYVLGYEFFCENTFEVNESTLVPRAETEYLVENMKLVLEKETPSTTKRTLVDVGTGSGCVGISLMKSVGNFFNKCFLLDISKDALVVAEKNVGSVLSKENGTKVFCLESDLLGTLMDHNLGELYIVANLPYIPETFVGVEPDVKKWEPKSALYSGEDGLAHYRKLLVQLSLFKEKKVVLMEMMKEQYLLLKGEFLGLGEWNSNDTFHDNIIIASLFLGS